MRETGRFLFFFAGELEPASDVSGRARSRSSSPASAIRWLRDDGFGSEVVEAARGSASCRPA